MFKPPLLYILKLYLSFVNFEFLNCSENWQAARQHCCPAASQFSKQYRDFTIQSQSMIKYLITQSRATKSPPPPFPYVSQPYLLIVIRARAMMGGLQSSGTIGATVC